MSSQSCKQCCNADRGGMVDDSVRYLSIQDDNLSFLSMEDSKEYMIESPRYNYLCDVKDAPWNINTLRQALRKTSRLRSREHLFTDKALWEISRILKNYLARLAREILRFSRVFNMCTRNEVYSAAQIVFSKTVSRACIGNAYQAYFLYVHSVSKNTDKHLRVSKAERSGLTLSVGKVFRWMIRNKIAPHLTDSAAIYLTAILEYLAEEICLLSDQSVNRKKAGGVANYSVLADDILPSLAAKPDIWRAAQQCEHLCVTKTQEPYPESSDVKTQDMFFQPTRHFMRDENNNGSARCFGSREELVSILERGNASDLPDTPRHRSVRRMSSPAVMLSSSKPSSARAQGIPWCNSAIDLLFDFVKCSKMNYVEDGEPEDVAFCSLIQESIPCEDAHPISEWIRVSGVFMKSRLGKYVDEDDVRQAARVLVPSSFCSPRKLWPESDINRPSLPDLQENVPKSTKRLADPVLLKAALEMKNRNERKRLLLNIGIGNLNKLDEKGMNLMMYASLHGNKGVCEDIIEKGVSTNIKVPSDAFENDRIPATIKGWTALSFAVIMGHNDIVKLLLDNGAVPDECHHHAADDTVVLSPLQLAVAAGHFSTLTHMLTKIERKSILNEAFQGYVMQDAEENMERMYLHSLAAAHGHRRALRKLIDAQEHVKEQKISNSAALSLKEALAENSEQGAESEKEHCKSKIFKDAMYHSAEHGYINVTLEIRKLGIPWNYHTWVTTLSYAHEYRNMDSVHSLLADFPDFNKPEIMKAVKENHIEMLFNIFRFNLNSSCTQPIAGIISFLYGDVPKMEVLCTEEEGAGNLPKIGTKFVNNKDMSDIVFKIDGEDFYAHRIILQNASKKLKDLTKCVDEKGKVKIDGIKYSVFETAMQFLYSGGVLYQSQPEKVLELLKCAAKLQLPSLKQTCEFESARHLTPYNAVDVYTSSKSCKAYQLEKYCYHYFLANLSLMISRDEFIFLLERHSNIIGYLEQEFMQSLFGNVEESSKIIKATYL